MKNRGMIPFIALVFIFVIPLVYAGNYNAGTYGSKVYGIGEVTESSTPESPTPETPSGGGISGEGESSCYYDWQCINWFPSICPESGIRERICVNKGTCNGIEEMPSLNQTCEYLGQSEPLFDIYLTLQDKYKEICSGDKIKANIKLENYAKVELLDAFMTYWVVDENNKLIVESKDTRAVEKEISFNIELDIPKSTSPGAYRFYSEITYSGNKTAVAGETFEVLSQENCEFFSSKRFNWMYLVYGVAGIIAILLILLMIKLFESKFRIIKNKSKPKVHREYKNKIKENLKRIRGKTFLTILAGLMLMVVLFIGKSEMTGFVVENSSEFSNNWNTVGFILIAGILGLLVFAYRKKIVEKIEIKRINKYSRSSIKGLIKKKVYSEDGNYLGKVSEIILSENRIDSLRIKLEKKYRIKGIIMKYKNIKGVGHIVIVDEKISEKID